MCLRWLIYNENHPSAFICYKHADDDSLPNLIREHLKNKGYFAFLNHQDIRPGEDYDNYLARSIKNAANFILVVTESTFLEIIKPDDYVSKEIRMAFKYKKRIIPVINLDKSGIYPGVTELPPDIQKLNKIQFIEYQHKNPDQTLKRIRKALKKPWIILSQIILILLLVSLALFLLFKGVPQWSLKNMEAKIKEKDSVVLYNTTPDSLPSPGNMPDPDNMDSGEKTFQAAPSNHIRAANEFLKKTGMDTLLRESMNYRNTYLSSRLQNEVFEKALSGLKEVSDLLNDKGFLTDSSAFYFKMASEQYEKRQSEYALENYYKTIKSAIPDFK